MNIPNTMSPPARRSSSHRAIIDSRSASERGSVAIQDIHGRRCVTLSAMATLRAGASLARQGRMARRRTAESIIDSMLSRKEREKLAPGVEPSRRCAALSVIRAGTLPSIQLGNSLRREEVVAGGITARVSRLINLAQASIRECTRTGFEPARRVDALRYSVGGLMTNASAANGTLNAIS